MERKTRNKIYHGMSIAFIIIAVCFSVFRFEVVFFRLMESFIDLLISIAYYLVEVFGWMFGLERGLIKPTVTRIPDSAISLLPLTWGEFCEKIKLTGQLMVSEEALQAYIDKIVTVLMVVSRALIPIIMLIGTLFLVAWITYRKPTKHHNVDTDALKKWKRWESVVGKPVIFFRRYRRSFLRCWKWYRITLILIWLYNFNVITIALEFAAFYFYFAKSFNLKSVYTFVVKAFLDLSIPFEFLPLIVEIPMFAYVFHKWRCSIGLELLRKYIKKIEDLLNSFIGALFAVGKQRARKTTLITVLSVIQSALYRKTAKKAMKKRRKQFPRFPWRILEDVIRASRKKHVIYTKALSRKFVRDMRDLYERRDVMSKQQRRRKIRELQRIYGYNADNLIFGYKDDCYRMTYNDGLEIINVWDAIEAYAQLYFIYTTPVLVFANLGIRFDEVKKSKGNFENFDLDFVNRNPKEMSSISQYAHIWDRDMSRFGVLMEKGNPNAFALEYGVLVGMEMAKEVGNQVTNTGIKKEAEECNPKNDGFSDWIKTVTHMATVDNDTYIRPLYDDHRPDSMGAENKDLCNIFRIKKTGDSKLALPFFAFEELLWLLGSIVYDWIEDKMSFLHGENTLLMYLIDKIFLPFDAYCLRIVKKYSVYKTHYWMKDGMDDEVLQDKKSLTIPECLAFNRRFATDGLGEYFYQRALRSTKGIDDIRQYKDIHMTFDEMLYGNSHFYTRLGEAFKLSVFMEAKAQREKWLKERKEKEKAGKKQAQSEA